MKNAKIAQYQKRNYHRRLGEIENNNNIGILSFRMK